MNCKSLSLPVGLLFTLSSSFILAATQSAVAQSQTASDVSGFNVTTTVQNAGSTTTPGNPGNNPAPVVVPLVTPAIVQAVNGVALSFLSIDSSTPTTYAFTTPSGQPFSITVTPESQAAAVALLKSEPPSVSDTIITKAFVGISGPLLTGNQIQQLLGNPANAAAVQFLASIPFFGINSNQSVQAIAREFATSYGRNTIGTGETATTFTPLNAQLANQAIVLALSLQGLSNNGKVDQQRLINAVQAYNILVNTASITSAKESVNSTGERIQSVLGPNLGAIQAVLGKMVDAAYAAK